MQKPLCSIFEKKKSFILDYKLVISSAKANSPDWPLSDKKSMIYNPLRPGEFFTKTSLNALPSNHPCSWPPAGGKPWQHGLATNLV